MSLHTTESGDPAAPTVVLLHGLGVTSWMWDDVAARLADRFHCVAVDLPRQGESHAVPWESMAGTADLVADVIARVAPDGRADVVGLSQGGYVALALLARHPGAVRSAVVSGVATRRLVRPRLQGAVVRAAVVLLRSRLVARIGGALMGLHGPERAAYVEGVARLSPTTIERIYRELLDHRLPDGLDAVADRLLAVAGDREAGAIRRSLTDLAAAGATAARVPRAAHAWVAQHPELFARTVADWVGHRRVPAELEPVPAVRSAAGPDAALKSPRG
ncbi:alpha/beta fold hydrolase [Pseudonocardia humida]|uniref:Alpha/beta fold hydrolase n=1 Tax=Pseudonocardia humida TaxID=2800819 RepID=A0ABT1A4H6_9PSEU|nr:alpha/beta hydrolase [Pseudonocardia humida]MCO1657910.1 alpha/beta fold hydrolase [Pseudonocardia humida]